MLVDAESINTAEKAGLKDEVFTIGRMSNKLYNKVAYCKLKLKRSWALSKWSQHGYWSIQEDILRPKNFEDTIERVNINEITTE